MTVQSIKKSVAADTNLTQATQTTSQQATSGEDAFLTLLQAAAERFGRQSGTQVSPDKILAQHFASRADEAVANKSQARDTGSARSDRTTTTSAKDNRLATKADKPRQTQSKDTASKTSASDDNTAATAQTATADDSQPAAVVDDNSAPDSAPRDAKDQPQAQDDGSRAQAQQNDAAAVAAQQQAVVEIDVQVTETVQIIETVQTGVTPQMAQAALAAAKDPQATAQAAAQAQAAQADTGDKDRQKVTDLEGRIVKDLASGDMDDAMDAATELVSQLVSQAGQQQTAAAKDPQATAANSDIIKQQADDLSSMLTDTGAQLQVSVQVSRAADTGQQTANPTAETLTQVVEAAQTPVAAADPSAQTGQQQQQGNSADQTAQTVQTVSLASQLPTEQPLDSAQSFSAILAAQVEASNQDAAAVQDQKPATTPVATIGATQAADKTSAASQTAQTARTQRVPLQQQVMEQVSVQIDKAVKEGSDTIKIQLRPHDLGKIEVKLEVTDGRVTATVTAEKPETLALLQKDSKGLEKALEDAGLTPDTNATSFSLKNGDQQNTAERDASGNRRGRARGGNASDDDAAPAAAQVVQPRNSGSLAGVDISV